MFLLLAEMEFELMCEWLNVSLGRALNIYFLMQLFFNNMSNIWNVNVL